MRPSSRQRAEREQRKYYPGRSESDDRNGTDPRTRAIDELVAFMASLTSADYKEQGLKELARQRALSRTNRPQRDTARAFGPKPPRPELPKIFLTPLGAAEP